MITGLSLGRFDELLGPSLWVRGNVKWKNVFSLWGFDNAGESFDRIVVMGKSNRFGGMRLRWVNFYSAAEPRAIHPKQMLCGGDGVRWEPPNTYHALQRLAGVGDYFSVLPLVPQGLLVLRFLQRASLEMKVLLPVDFHYLMLPILHIVIGLVNFHVQKLRDRHFQLFEL